MPRSVDDPIGSNRANVTSTLNMLVAARDAGVKFAIDTDAHSTTHLGYLPFGIGQAQRGWLTPDDVINTWPLPKLQAFLRKGR